MTAATWFAVGFFVSIVLDIALGFARAAILDRRRCGACNGQRVRVMSVARTPAFGAGRIYVAPCWNCSAGVTIVPMSVCVSSHADEVRPDDGSPDKMSPKEIQP